MSHSPLPKLPSSSRSRSLFFLKLCLRLLVPITTVASGRKLESLPPHMSRTAILLLPISPHPAQQNPPKLRSHGTSRSRPVQARDPAIPMQFRKNNPVSDSRQTRAKGLSILLREKPPRELSSSHEAAQASRFSFSRSRKSCNPTARFSRPNRTRACYPSTSPPITSSPAAAPSPSNL